MDLRENVNSIFIYLFKVRNFSVWLFFFWILQLQSFIAIPISSGIFSSWLTFAMISSVGYHAHIWRRNSYFPLLLMRKLTGVLSDFSTKVMQLARSRTGNGAQTGSMPKLRPFFQKSLLSPGLRFHLLVSLRTSPGRSAMLSKDFLVLLLQPWNTEAPLESLLHLEFLGLTKTQHSIIYGSTVGWGPEHSFVGGWGDGSLQIILSGYTERDSRIQNNTCSWGSSPQWVTPQGKRKKDEIEAGSEKETRVPQRTLVTCSGCKAHLDFGWPRKDLYNNQW